MEANNTFKLTPFNHNGSNKKEANVASTSGEYLQTKLYALLQEIKLNDGFSKINYSLTYSLDKND